MPISTLFTDPAAANELARRIDARKDQERRARMLGFSPSPARNTRRRFGLLRRFFNFVAGRPRTCCISRR